MCKLAQQKGFESKGDIYPPPAYVTSANDLMIHARNWLIDVFTPAIDLDRSKGGLAVHKSLFVRVEPMRRDLVFYRDETERNPIGSSNGSQRESAESVNIMTAATRESEGNE